MADVRVRGRKTLIAEIRVVVVIELPLLSERNENRNVVRRALPATAFRLPHGLRRGPGGAGRHPLSGKPWAATSQPGQITLHPFCRILCCFPSDKSQILLHPT
jgi:hypothetical protein